MIGTGFGRMQGKVLWIVLLLILLMSFQVWGMQQNVERSDFLTGSKDYYTKEEMTEIVVEIMKIAEEEIEKTAVEAGKEATAVLIGDVEYYKILTDRRQDVITVLQDENLGIAQENRWLKIGLFTTGGISIGAIVFGLLCGFGD